MNYQLLLVAIISNFLVIPISISYADNMDDAGSEKRAQMQIYGSQLMTEQERAEHRERVWSAKNREERHIILAEHHRRMQERAKERGIKLPPPLPKKRMKYRYNNNFPAETQDYNQYKKQGDGRRK
jgi:hypothetical protein